jgi:hypothetical protein
MITEARLPPYTRRPKGIGTMKEKKSDPKIFIRMLPDLIKLGVVTKEGAAKLREADAKGLLPKTCDGQRRLVRSINEFTDAEETKGRGRKTRAVLNSKKVA